MENQTKKIIVLVSVGVFQEYILDNIRQLIYLDFEIHVITDKVYFPKLGEVSYRIRLIDANTLNIGNFNKKSQLNKKFRRGFWINTSKRLFLVYEYLKKFKIQNVIHLENDVLLYNKMLFGMDNKIHITMDAKNRCIPGIIYIPNHTLMENLIKNYNYKKNDMENMAMFYHQNKDIVKTFPIIHTDKEGIYSRNFKEFDSIFDGAAIGQYLGGVDPRNKKGDTRGFVNETCVVKYNTYKFVWKKIGEVFYPHLEADNKLIPINNLHIHCKKLKNFMMDAPDKNKYITNIINT